MAYNFGVGNLYITPSTANATPVLCGVLKDVNVSTSFEQKSLYGQFQFPIDSARGQGKMSIKAKNSLINGGTIYSVLAGASPTVGSEIGVANESATVPATSPYTRVVSNGATFKSDLGIFNVTKNKFMSRGSSVATNTYTVNETTGTYTFDAGNSSDVLQISYSYTSTTVGYTTSLSNQLMGAGTTFSVRLFNQFKANSFGILLYAVTFSKFDMGFKQSDYTEQDLEGEAFASSTGKIVDFFTAD